MVLKMEMTDLTSKHQTTPSKYGGLGAFMAAKLVIGFWFGIRVIVAIRMLNSLDYYVEELLNGKQSYCL